VKNIICPSANLSLAHAIYNFTAIIGVINKIRVEKRFMKTRIVVMWFGREGGIKMCVGRIGIMWDQDKDNN